MTYRENGQSAPVEGDRAILVLGINGEVVGLNRLSGDIVWRNGLAGGGRGEVYLALRFGVLVVSAGGGGIFRLDYHRGDTLWRQDTMGTGRATLLVEPDVIYAAKPGTLEAFTHDGQRVWHQPLTGLGFGRISIGLPGNVAQADEVGRG